MNIKILDSWLKEYVKTEATPQKIAEVMSLTSVSIERIEKYGNDYIYDIEVTTNRPDLMSVIGLARETATVLPQYGIPAKFVRHQLNNTGGKKNGIKLKIVNDPQLVYRVCAVVMDVKLSESPKQIKDRLESSDIRSLNNLIDVTNYVMRTIGHPAHVFDYDRIADHLIKIRASQKSEKITTLDGKSYSLPGGDIIAEDGNGKIIDLLGVMGLENSVVTNYTKRIILFINNNDPHNIRKTSMNLGIRTEAAQMNEKHIDPELAMDALLYGIELYKELAEGKVVSEIIDIYPKPYKQATITVDEKKIQNVIGIPISLKEAAAILERLDFKTKIAGDAVAAIVPSFRAHDVTMPEDLIEEIARIYGYHNIPTALPPLENNSITQFSDEFYWEQRLKEAMKYWGFTEVYTYSMVSETMYEGDIKQAVAINNPLTEDMVYMRNTLIPSLLQTIKENSQREVIKIFEIANVYHKKSAKLPDEKRMFSGVIKKPDISFFEVKGLFEQLIRDLGIDDVHFKQVENEAAEIEILTGSEKLGIIEILDQDLIDFECDFSVITKYASLKKTFTPLPKYPPIIEDMAFVIPENMLVGEIMNIITKQSKLIRDVQLFDKYRDVRTFRITYQAAERNLTTEEITPIREKITTALKSRGLILKG